MKKLWRETTESKLDKKIRKAIKPYLSEEVIELARGKSLA